MVSTSLVLQVIASGLLMGGLYALIAVGLTLTYGILHILNLAHGALVVLGGFIGFWGWEMFGLNPLFMIIPTMVILFVISVPVKKMLFDPIEGTELLNQLLLTFGIAIALEALMALTWGSSYRNISWNAFTGSITIPVLGINLPYNRLTAFIISILFFGALYMFIYKTKIGRGIRATAESKDTASVVGVNVNRIERIVFGIGFALAGASGVLLISVVPLNPYTGVDYVLLAFIIVTLGGMGSIGGSLIGGLLIGVTESLLSIWTSLTEANAIVFLLLIGIFLVRPSGLFGQTIEGLANE